MKIKYRLIFFTIFVIVGQTTVMGQVNYADLPRYQELRNVINENTGYAHMTRGMNACTILALRDSVTDADIPVLKALLSDDDHVSQITAMNVLSILGDDGIAAIKKAETKLDSYELDGAIRRAKDTERSIEVYRKRKLCQKKTLWDRLFN